MDKYLKDIQDNLVEIYNFFENGFGKTFIKHVHDSYNDDPEFREYFIGLCPYLTQNKERYNFLAFIVNFIQRYQVQIGNLYDKTDKNSLILFKDMFLHIVKYHDKLFDRYIYNKYDDEQINELKIIFELIDTTSKIIKIYLKKVHDYGLDLTYV